MANIDKIKEMIANQLSISVEEVSEEKEIVKDLGADSLDIVEMLMTLEEEYNITIPDEETGGHQNGGRYRQRARQVHQISCFFKAARLCAAFDF